MTHSRKHQPVFLHSTPYISKLSRSSPKNRTGVINLVSLFLDRRTTYVSCLFPGVRALADVVLLVMDMRLIACKAVAAVEKSKRRACELKLERIRLECRSPFVVPEVFDSYVAIAQLTSELAV